MTSGDRSTLVDHFEALPVSAFSHPATDAEGFLRHLFGPQTTCRAMVHCAGVGAWVDGWSVVTVLPEGGGTYGFTIHPDGRHGVLEEDWGELSRGGRINLLSAGVATALSAADPVGLLVAAADQVEASHRYREVDLSRPGVFNGDSSLWLAHHVHGLLAEDPDGVVAGAQFVLSLSLREGVERLLGLLARVGHVQVNWQESDAAEQEVSAAVRRYNGVTLTGYQVERLGLCGALMYHPRSEWPAQADRLVADAYAEQELPAPFHPPAPSPGGREPVAVRGGRFPLVG